MFTNQDYRKGSFLFPDMEVSSEKKDTNEYTKQMAEAIYSRYQKNRTGIKHSYASIFDDLRNYGRGLQGQDKYKSYLSGPNSTSSSGSGGIPGDTDGVWNRNRTFERKGWMNVLWDIVSPAVKIRDMIHGMFDDVDFDIMADAIDADSGAEEEDKKWRLWATTRTFIKGNLDRLRAKAGLPPEALDFIPENLTELEMYQAAGGFKVAYAKSLEKLIRHTEEISNWKHTLKRKLLDDVIDTNVCAARCEYDEDRKKENWRYVDPEHLVIQYSKNEDYDDAEYAGELEEVKISEVREGLLRWGYAEKDIEKIAKEHCGKPGNPPLDEWAKYNKLSPAGVWGYDDFKVLVFRFEWIDHEKIKKVKYENKYGKTRYHDYDGKKPGNRGKVVTTTIKHLHQGTWVVGTEYCYDFGKAYYQPRPQPHKVALTYKVVQLEGKSLSHRLIPIYDNIQISWLKYQNALSAIFEEGYAVDFRMLSNISDGDDKLSAQEAIKMWKESGLLPFMSVPVGQFYRGGNVVPAHKLPGGMGTALNDAIGRLQLSLQHIEMITGLTPISLGMRPDPNAPVQTSERSLEATHNALKPLIRSVFNMKTNLGRVTACRIQQLCKYDNESEKAYAKVIGLADVKSLTIAKDANVEYGIKLEARPTAQEKIHILRAAEMALAPGRNGQPGIEYSDYMYIVERLYAGANLKELRLYLVSAKRRQQAKAQQEMMQMQEQKARQEQALEQQRMQKEAAKIRMDTESKITVDNNKHKNTMEEKLLEMNQTYINELSKMSEREIVKEGMV